MSKEADVLNIGGDFCIYGDEGKCTLTAGTLTVKGNFTQKGTDSYTEGNFKATGTHKVILAGTGEQRISFDSTWSYFQNLSVTEGYCGKIILANWFQCKNLDSGIAAESAGVKIDELNLNGKEMNITGDVTVDGNIDIAHGKLIVNGKVNQPSGTMNLDGGTLDISGDYIIAKEGKNSTTDEFEYQYACAGLQMSKEADVLNIGGDFCIYGYDDKCTLTAGTLIVKGNFTQKGTNRDTADNFAATGTHTVILDGTNHQNVSFDSTSSYFNNLKLTKDKEEGYTFTPENCWMNLYLDTNVRTVTITPDKPTVVQNDTQQFIAKVEGINKPDQSVTWSLSGNDSEETTISESGLLKVSLEETAKTLTVTATSVMDDTKSGSVEVAVEKATPIVHWVKIAPSNLSLGRGEKYQLKATVSGVNKPSQEVTWSLEGNESDNTIVSKAGEVTVGKDETSEKLKVTAKSVIDKSKSASIEIEVWEETEEQPVATVTKVKLSTSEISMNPGDSYTFAAKVLGSNHPSQEVLWNVTGHQSENTLINEEGMLTVGKDEKSETVTVTATSKQDVSKTAEAIVTVVPIEIISTVDKVTVTLQQGTKQKLTAKVTGANNPNQEVVWSLSGNKSADTRITENGELIIAKDETAEVIVVKATSAQDSNKYGTFAIQIEKTERRVPETPSAPKAKSVTETKVVLEKQEGFEYCIGDGEWQTSNIFEHLQPGVTYRFYQRKAETELSYASLSSDALEITLPKKKCNHERTELYNQKNATCVVQGYTGDTYCKECGAKVKGGSVIPLKNHTWSNWVVTKKATYTENGNEERRCSVCGKKENRIVGKLNRVSISGATVSGISSMNYTGKSITFSKLTVKVNGLTLKKGTDYTIQYKNNKNIGKGKVVITGIGKYNGTVNKTFTILVSKNKVYTVKGMKYKVTNANIKGKGTVTLVGSTKKKSDAKFTSLSVGNTVSIGGKTFKITAVGDKAFKGYGKLKKVLLGNNITSIGKEAFCNCKKLKTISIKSTKLKEVRKNAILKIDKKAVIKVPSNKMKAYKKLFQSRTGFKSSMKIKK